MTKISLFQRAGAVLKCVEFSVEQRIPSSFKMVASEIADSMLGDRPLPMSFVQSLIGGFSSIFGTGALLSLLPNLPPSEAVILAMAAGGVDLLANMYLHEKLDKLAEPSRKKRNANISCCDSLNSSCGSCPT
jgi:hypothetical protein